MTNQNLKKLSRKELLELMLAQEREIERLKQQLSAAEEQLAQREICIQQSGTMAEAALKLNQVFQQADAAAQQYLASVQNLEKQQQEALARIQAQEKKLGTTPKASPADDIPSVWRKLP
jgi:glutathione S-transferase